VKTPKAAHAIRFNNLREGHIIQIDVAARGSNVFLLRSQLNLTWVSTKPTKILDITRRHDDPMIMSHMEEGPQLGNYEFKQVSEEEGNF
jgi:hypothetical protein